jgi:hypothetical protein
MFTYFKQYCLRAGRLSPKFTQMSVLAVWTVVMSAGFFALFAYEFKAADASAGGDTWPDTTGVLHSKNKTTLLFFAHAKCPCTAASVAELNRLLSAYGNQFDTTAVLVVPDGAGKDWENTAVAAAIRRLPDTVVIVDRSGAVARAFGARTSGETMVFGKNKALLFRGGVTASRGHEGSNQGIAALKEIASTRETSTVQFPVFGCALFSHDEEGQSRGAHDKEVPTP